MDNWGEVKKLTASDGAAIDNFGYRVSISGDTAIVGAFQDDDNGLNSGSAYIFSRDQGGLDNWGEVKKLTASDGAAGDSFGFSVSISGDTAIVGAHGDNDNGSSSGPAYIFLETTPDSDEDGISDEFDNCVDVYNPDQDDTDLDGEGDACDDCPNDPDNDVDEDGVCGDIDNCPDTSNPDQSDYDEDGLGDICDDDADNDGFTFDIDCNDLDPSINPGACDIKRDGIDQDCDGRERRRGRPCNKERKCSDGIDNDSDGLIDCDDPDCSKKKYCRNQNANGVITLTPPYPEDAGFVPDLRERGAFITALNTFTIDSIGIEANTNINPVNLTLNIYSASGFTRGSLLETSSQSFTIDSPGFYDIPINFTFYANEEYDIAIEPDQTARTRVFIFDPTEGDLPFNVENMIEVRDGEIDGDSSNLRLPHFQINIVP